MNETPVYAAPYEESVGTQLRLTNGLYEVSIISPHEMAESVKAEEQFYFTLCEDEETPCPIYHEPSCDEQNIYEVFEGEGFDKLHHKEIV